ncbi:MAG: PqqD family protein [Prevotella sp.]|nr:PqqD family protein [Prevotella sp.]MBQ9202825.1 PqqD family protein [Prevotella sp.]
MEISKNVTWKPLGEKVVAVKVETGEYYTMNEVASLIWKALNEGKSVDDIAKQISEEYDNDDLASIKNDIEEQLSEWKQELLIL